MAMIIYFLNKLHYLRRIAKLLRIQRKSSLFFDFLFCEVTSVVIILQEIEITHSRTRKMTEREPLLNRSEEELQICNSLDVVEMLNQI